jgi:integrase
MNATTRHGRRPQVKLFFNLLPSFLSPGAAMAESQKTIVRFRDAALLYLQSGGESRYLKPLIEYFGDRPLASIDQNAIDDAAKILRPAAAKSTQNRQVHTPASATLKCAAERGLCMYRRINRPVQIRGRRREVTREEANRLIKECSGSLRPFVVCLFFVDAGPGELLRLAWKQVNLDRAIVQFQANNGTTREEMLHPRVMASLRKLPHREGPVFRTPIGRTYSAKRPSIKTAFRAACRRAGIEDLSPRDCRNVLGLLNDGA